MATESSALSYPELVEQLVEQNQFVIHYDLEAVVEASRLLGIGRPATRVVLVAGTNGKGTTCAALNAYAQAAGLRVGLYTSPHLLSVRERIRFHSLPISEPAFVEAVGPVFKRFARASPDSRALSYFEILTLGAWRSMAQQELDLAVFEVGLGGRLDATNALDPDISIITGVALDHRDFLGDTLAEIATEKAGIARAGRTTIVHERAGAAPEVATAVKSRASVLRKVTEGTNPEEWNRALAWTAFEALYPAQATDQLRRVGDECLRWPGRRERVSAVGGDVFLDGAHNVQALVATAGWLLSKAPRGVDLVFGLSGKRAPLELLEAVGSAARRVIVTSCASAPSVPAEDIVEAAHQLGLEVLIAPSMGEALALAKPPRAVVGSLYLVGDALRTLGRSLEDLSIYSSANRSDSSR